MDTKTVPIVARRAHRYFLNPVIFGNIKGSVILQLFQWSGITRPVEPPADGAPRIIIAIVQSAAGKIMHADIKAIEAVGILIPLPP
jgi:hypothetical protein